MSSMLGLVSGLIEAYWNVNVGYGSTNQLYSTGLIEAYWNVNKQIALEKLSSALV